MRSSATLTSKSSSESITESQEHELFLSAIGASPLKQDSTCDMNAKSRKNPIAISSKDGTLIDSVTPKANTLLFHYLRRASLANHQQYIFENNKDQLEDNSQEYSLLRSEDKLESITLSPPSISSSSSLIPPSLAFSSDEPSVVSHEPSIIQGHSILMDFSPRIRKSISNPTTLTFLTPNNRTSLLDFQTPITPLNKTASETDPSLTLSMERLTVQSAFQEGLAPKALQFSTPLNYNSSTIDFKEESEFFNNDIDETHEKKSTEFSLEQFPIVFQVFKIFFSLERRRSSSITATL